MLSRLLLSTLAGVVVLALGWLVLDGGARRIRRPGRPPRPAGRHADVDQLAAARRRAERSRIRAGGLRG